MLVTDPNRTILNREESSITDLRRERHTFHLLQNAAPETQPMRNYHHPELLLFFKGFPFKKTPPKFFLLLCKITFLK